MDSDGAGHPHGAQPPQRARAESLAPPPRDPEANVVHSEPHHRAVSRGRPGHTLNDGSGYCDEPPAAYGSDDSDIVPAAAVLDRSPWPRGSLRSVLVHPAPACFLWTLPGHRVSPRPCESRDPGAVFGWLPVHALALASHIHVLSGVVLYGLICIITSA